MKSFPKKYTTVELRNRSANYRKKDNHKDSSDIIFTPNFLSSSKKLSYYDFFFIYLKDFFNHKSSTDNKRYNKQSENKAYEQLFIVFWNQLQDIASSYKFFSKRNQTLLQLWKDKIERHIISTNKKYTNTNLKILDSYTSSNHKIYIPDSDLYIYVLQQIRSLRENWKITNESKIWYRSFNLQTTISSDKIIWKEESVPYYVLKYFIGTKGEALYVYLEWDIDLCCWDVALLVHPKDKRYNKYIWKNAIIPLCNRSIPIIGDETVNISQNDWIKRVCPWVDEESIMLAKKHWLPTDIYAFDRQWLYTSYIHEKAFIWKERSKYYNNILEFIWDIWNMAQSWETIHKVPYSAETDERLTPYKIDQLILNLQEEKQAIIDELFQNNIKYPTLNNRIYELISEYDSLQEEKEDNSPYENIDGNETSDNEILPKEQANLDNTVNPDEFIDIQQEKEQKIKEQISNELKLPDYLICNNQILHWWRLPFISTPDWKLDFFDIEKDCLSWKQEPTQFCFDFVFLSLLRAWIIQTKDYLNDNKICECDKFYIKFLENEKKIEYLVGYLSTITWKKSEYYKFLEIIENLTDENNSTLKDFQNLTKKCKYLDIQWNWVISKTQWVTNDVIDSDFIELCIPCYLQSKWININTQTIFSEDEENKIFKQLEIQQLLLWKTITNSLIQYSYNQETEGDSNKLSQKFQSEQSKWETFAMYWENPIRLTLLINHSFDQKEILLNSLFLKQIWNSMRLCVQKDFLPTDIENCLKQIPEEFEEFDICILEKLNAIINERINIETYEQYITFFKTFKESIQSVFFSRYLEIIKVYPSKNVQFVCSYFFNLILTILYPVVPEFVDALQYISDRSFLCEIVPIQLDKSIDYNTSILYYTFQKIKQARIECNIKQHESCNIFIKSTPTICDSIAQHEQIFKNYFHISDITYIRSHEQTPLWYEIFSDVFDDSVMIWIQHCKTQETKELDTLESIEKNLRDLEDKLSILRQRIQVLPEWEQRQATEDEYAATKQEMENLTIKYRILASK